ncbi:GNAT family N-acetyltransferase [Kitasatospora sp. NPDC051853]|uniref:GNAT family N-acetyltransferase n=1 Tax=Kitasatospora sp. NPDC051853 TaxID=3364058 RepID=UPI0037A4E5F1
MGLSVADVAAASAAWVWEPENAEVVGTDGYRMVRLPEYYDFDLSVVSFTPNGPLGAAVDAVVQRAREFRVPVLDWQVLIGHPAGLAEELVARGGRVKLELEVLAADLGKGAPRLREPEVEVELRWATDAASSRDGAEVAVTGFGGELPPRERIEAAALRNARTVAAGEGGTLVAYVNGEPAGTSGVELVGGVARLTGGVVAPAWQRKGVYRALLAARLGYAAEHGARMALVKANPATSGPILRRAGFTGYGQEPVYAVPLAPPAGE